MISKSICNNDKLCNQVSILLLEFLHYNKRKVVDDKNDDFSTESGIENDEVFHQIFANLCTTFDLEESTIIYVLILIDKFIQKSKTCLNSKNIILITITAISLSLKINQDVVISGNDFAECCGLEKGQLSLMEGLFLKTINYKVVVESKFFNDFKEMISK